MRTNAAKESAAQTDYVSRKRVYVDTCVALAEAVLEHGDLSHGSVVARREECERARLLKDDGWRILQEVMFK